MMASMEMYRKMAKEVAEMREKAMNFQNTDWSEKSSLSFFLSFLFLWSRCAIGRMKVGSFAFGC